MVHPAKAKNTGVISGVFHSLCALYVLARAAMVRFCQQSHKQAESEHKHRGPDNAETDDRQEIVFVVSACDKTKQKQYDSDNQSH